ncbi:MAG: hypothetical protein COB53_13535 [Elusimicrobia bacterium]|nr:MAG: hypothetical protein COB53_13535 [Elusimicrobiota bacterium]
MKKQKIQQDSSIYGICARVALALVVVAAPLAWTRAVYSIYTLPKLLLLAVGLVLAWTAVLGSGDRRGSAGPVIERSLAVLWLVILISTVGSVDLYTSLFGRYNDYAYGHLAMGLYTVAFLWGAGMSKEERRRFGLWAVVGAGLVGLFALTQKTGFRPLLQFSLPGGRAVSTIGSPVHLGAYLAAAIAIAIPLKQQSHRGLRWLCAVLILGGLAVSISRGAWIAGLVGVGIVLSPAIAARLPNRFRIWWFPVIVGLSLAAAVSFASRLRPVAGSDFLRTEAWRASVSMIRERPLFGFGPDTFGVEFRKRKSVDFVRIGGSGLRHEHAHNDLMQAATTTGVVGLLAYLALLLALLWEFKRRFNAGEEFARTEALRFAGAVAAVFIAAKFNPMSTEVLVLASMAAGACLASLQPESKGGVQSGALQAGGAWIFSIAIACGSLWLCVGDHFSQKGRLLAGVDAVNAHRRANAVNACETQFTRRYVNLLLDLARENRTLPVRFEYLDAARDSTARTAGCRTGSFEAHYISGFVALLESQLGRPDRISVAQRELDAAIVLDPTHAAVLNARATVARTAGKPARAAEFSARAANLMRRN